MSSHLSRYKISSIFIATILVAVGLWQSAFATSSVTEAYPHNPDLKPGFVVSLDEENGELILASRNNLDRLFGVVILPADSAIRLQEEGEKTYVATVGEAVVFASDINGEIKPGDKLTISPISGVAMKAEIGTNIIGIALDPLRFDSESHQGVKQLTNESGQTVNANIGTIGVQVQIAQGQGTGGFDFLNQVGQSVAGKQVSGTRLYAALLIFVLTTFVSGGILFGVFRSAITSIGRNPLSQKSVFRGMSYIAFVAMGIFVVGLGSSYLILIL